MGMGGGPVPVQCSVGVQRRGTARTLLPGTLNGTRPVQGEQTVAFAKADDKLAKKRQQLIRKRELSQIRREKKKEEFDKMNDMLQVLTKENKELLAKLDELDGRHKVALKENTRLRSSLKEKDEIISRHVEAKKSRMGEIVRSYSSDSVSIDQEFQVEDDEPVFGDILEELDSLDDNFAVGGDPEDSVPWYSSSGSPMGSTPPGSPLSFVNETRVSGNKRKDTGDPAVGKVAKRKGPQKAVGCLMALIFTVSIFGRSSEPAQVMQNHDHLSVQGLRDASNPVVAFPGGELFLKKRESAHRSREQAEHETAIYKQLQDATKKLISEHGSSETSVRQNLSYKPNDMDLFFRYTQSHMNNSTKTVVLEYMSHLDRMLGNLPYSKTIEKSNNTLRTSTTEQNPKNTKVKTQDSVILCPRAVGYLSGDPSQSMSLAQTKRRSSRKSPTLKPSVPSPKNVTNGKSFLTIYLPSSSINAPNLKLAQKNGYVQLSCRVEDYTVV